MLSLLSSVLFIMLSTPICLGFQLFKFPFQILRRDTQLNSLVVQNCEVPEPYGKYRLQFKFVPETIFYVTNEKSNYTSDMSLTRKGLVCPILGWREAEVRGEMLETAVALKYATADGYRAYVIPGGTSVPDSLLFLQDTRLDTSKEYERGYFMAPSEACYPHEFEKLLVDFVMQKDHFCFSLYNSPQGGRNLPCNTIGSGTVE